MTLYLGDMIILKEGLQEHIESLDKFMTDNLYHTSETREAIKHLMIVQMWAERSSKLNGVKKVRALNAPLFICNNLLSNLRSP